MHGRAEEAEKVLMKLHADKSDPDNLFAHSEMIVMKHQIDYEMQHRLTIRDAFRQPSMRRRFLVGWLAMSGTQAGGLIVVLSRSALYTVSSQLLTSSKRIKPLYTLLLGSPLS